MDEQCDVSFQVWLLQIIMLVQYLSQSTISEDKSMNAYID